jgi:hypothetical protein
MKTAQMTPEQALEFAAQLTATAHRVIEARKTRPGSYGYVREELAQLRVRVGEVE